MSKNGAKFIDISEEEQKLAQGFIDMRRGPIIMKPNKKISINDILGFIDKKGGKVIFNPNYRVSEINAIELHAEEQDNSSQ